MLGLKDVEISRASGIPTSSLSRYRNGGSPKAEHVFPLADALKCSARWLIAGVDSTPLELADHADWIEVPEHDLRELTDFSKGPVISTTPMRKDWLSRTLNTANGIWLARLPADLPRYDLREGDLVFLRDVEPGEAQDGAVYIVRVWGHLTVARIDSMLATRMSSVQSNVQDRALAPRDIGTDDGQAILVARVLGAPLRRL